MPLFTPIGGGGGVPKATVTATTGSPSVDTSSRAGKTIYRFTGSGTITIGTEGIVEALLVAGGGSGGGNSAAFGTSGGGGGAGGHLYIEKLFLGAATYTVTVGAGGSATGAFQRGSNGSDSRILIGSVYYAVAQGGGAGGNRNGGSGTGGGSGGGAWSFNGSSSPRPLGAAGFTSQGNRGGDQLTTSMSGGACGGGGAGGASYDVYNSLTPSQGGTGLANSITGTSVTRGGGGGGGTYNNNASGYGGNGGGGAGGRSGTSGVPVAGTANTGGGGGGAGGFGSTSIAGAAGGSGVVIIVTG